MQTDTGRQTAEQINMQTDTGRQTAKQINMQTDTGRHTAEQINMQTDSGMQTAEQINMKTDKDRQNAEQINLNTEVRPQEGARPQEGQEIDTVIFDIGGVLVELGRYRFLAKKGFTGERADRVMSATMRSREWVQLDLNNLSEDEILQLFINNDPEIEEEIRHMFRDFEGIVERRDSTLAWLRRVKESGRRILFLSNYSPKVIRDCPDVLYFLPELEGGLFSCDVHMVKPDPDFYRMLIDKYGLEPSRCVFIDDLEANTEAAAALGMHTIHFETPEQAEAELDNLLG